MVRPTVLSLYDYTNTFLLPWASAGFECIAVDNQHPAGETTGIHPNITNIGADARHWIPPRDRDYVFVAAWPPCTHLAVSGARWFKGKGLRTLAESIELFARATEIAEWAGAPYLIENPVSTISTYWRKADYSFDPCDYAGYLGLTEGRDEEAYTKKTCLWTSPDFVMPPFLRIKPVHGSKMHRLPPSDERANLRSKTPVGFSRAVFQFNSPGADVVWRLENPQLELALPS